MQKRAMEIDPDRLNNALYAHEHSGITTTSWQCDAGKFWRHSPEVDTDSHSNVGQADDRVKKPASVEIWI